MKDLNKVKQNLNKSILAIIGQNKCCDSLPALNKAFDILIKETAEAVLDLIAKGEGWEESKEHYIKPIIKETMKNFKDKVILTKYQVLEWICPHCRQENVEHAEKLKEVFCPYCQRSYDVEKIK